MSLLNFIGEGIAIGALAKAVVAFFFLLDVMKDDNLLKPFTLESIMERGSVCVFLNGPKERLEFCLDGVFGRSGTKFEGFYLLSNDKVHFVSYRSGQDGPFITLILFPREPTVFLFDWSSTEELFKLKTHQKFENQQTDKLLEYPGLISYERFMNQQDGSMLLWTTFTRFITRDSVEAVFRDLRLLADEIGIYEVTPMIETHHSLLQVKNDDTKAIKFTQIPSIKAFSKSSQNPTLITKCALDRTPILKSLNVGYDAFLSELQISFILLTFAQNFEGFEQWIDIVSLLLQSYAASQDHFREYKQFLLTMREHLEMCPDDFFIGLMNENKLYKLLANFFMNTTGFEDEISFYERKFGWSFDGEDPEDAPTIVE